MTLVSPRQSPVRAATSPLPNESLDRDHASTSMSCSERYLPRTRLEVETASTGNGILSNRKATRAIQEHKPPARRPVMPAVAPARFQDLLQPESPEPWPTAINTLASSSKPDRREKAIDRDRCARPPVSRPTAISPAPLT